MRLIDADALFADFECAKWNDNTDRDAIAEELLIHATTIDTEPVVHAHWIEDTSFSCVCSNCGKGFYGLTDQQGKRCPHCGAKMDGKEGTIADENS